MLPDQPAFSVSELNHQAKMLLESHFDFVRVEGEIGDFTAASSGHWYFTLKDSSAQVRCAMFKGANSKLKFRPGKGDSVRIRARVSLYENRGEFQLIVQHIEPAGEGALQLAFDKLKAKLQAEGLFDHDRKRAVPEAAKTLGVVTSASGAALHDILSVLERRSPMTQVYLFPVPVQGTDAPAAIVAAIEQANRMAKHDLPLEALIVGRGGGSLEDLWAFNDEAVARAIAASALPIVSAVGHEVDFSIADFVADQRAATPSAAAELVSLDQDEWFQRLDRMQLHLDRALRQRILRQRERLDHLKERLRHPGKQLAQQKATLNTQRNALGRLLKSRLSHDRLSLDAVTRQLRSRHPRGALQRTAEQLKGASNQLRSGITRRLEAEQSSLTQAKRLLETLGPENTLSRGYAIVQTSSGKRIVRDACTVTAGDRLTLRLHRGSLETTIDRVDEVAEQPK